MSLFLLATCVANGAFLLRAVKRMVGDPDSVPGLALVAQAVAELCWAIPCFIQCTIVFIMGSDGGWYQGFENSKAGCDIMGFYSVFSLVAGMGTTAVMAFVTERLVRDKPLPGRGKATAVILIIFVLALIYACLPLMGLHHYKYISPICYYDWYDTSHSILILLWTVPVLALGTLFFACAAMKRPIFFLHLCTFSFCWVLWIPAAIIGLADAEMPKHMMIFGAVLGHGQALIDPLLYGLIWSIACPEVKKGSADRI